MISTAPRERGKVRVRYNTGGVTTVFKSNNRKKAASGQMLTLMPGELFDLAELLDDLCDEVDNCIIDIDPLPRHQGRMVVRYSSHGDIVSIKKVARSITLNLSVDDLFSLSELLDDLCDELEDAGMS